MGKYFNSNVLTVSGIDIDIDRFKAIALHNNEFKIANILPCPRRLEVAHGILEDSSLFVYMSENGTKKIAPATILEIAKNHTFTGLEIDPKLECGTPEYRVCKQTLPSKLNKLVKIFMEDSIDINQNVKKWAPAGNQLLSYYEAGKLYWDNYVATGFLDEHDYKLKTWGVESDVTEVEIKEFVDHETSTVEIMFSTPNTWPERFIRILPTLFPELSIRFYSEYPEGTWFEMNITNCNFDLVDIGDYQYDYLKDYKKMSDLDKAKLMKRIEKEMKSFIKFFNEHSRNHYAKHK